MKSEFQIQTTGAQAKGWHIHVLLPVLFTRRTRASGATSVCESRTFHVARGSHALTPVGRSLRREMPGPGRDTGRKLLLVFKQIVRYPRISWLILESYDFMLFNRLFIKCRTKCNYFAHLYQIFPRK